MSAQNDNLAQAFITHLEQLKKQHGDALTMDHIANSMESISLTGRGNVVGALEAIAEKIQMVKVELSESHPKRISDDFIPSANLELDEVVKATEEATNKILDTAEKIQMLCGNIPEKESAEIMALITEIFEACNFQDITGQRIRKVIKTLMDIDTTVADLLRALSSSSYIKLKSTERKSSAEIAAEKLMGGPQLEAPSQDDIDKLFANS